MKEPVIEIPAQSQAVSHAIPPLVAPELIGYAPARPIEVPLSGDPSRLVTIADRVCRSQQIDLHVGIHAQPCDGVAAHTVPGDENNRIGVVGVDGLDHQRRIALKLKIVVRVSFRPVQQCGQWSKGQGVKIGRRGGIDDFVGLEEAPDDDVLRVQRSGGVLLMEVVPPADVNVAR